MPTFATQAYGLLSQILLFNITPMLPAATVGVRQPVGTPETIPEITFLARRLRPGDGYPTSDLAHSNGYTDMAEAYHRLFGLAPTIIESLNDIFLHYATVQRPTTIKRLRLVSHGNNSFVTLPLFTGLPWPIGIQGDILQAFQSNDANGIRFILTQRTDPNKSPLFANGVHDIVDGIRGLHISPDPLAPFGLGSVYPDSPSVSSAIKLFFDVINDFYQIRNGVVFITTTGSGQGTPITQDQKNVITASLEIVEASVRKIFPAPIPTAALDQIKNTVLAATPTQLGIFGTQDFPASLLTNLATAMAATPRVENNLLFALSPQLFPNNSGRLLLAVNLFNPSVLRINGRQITDFTQVTNVPGLNNFFFLCNYLFALEKSKLTIAGAPITEAQKTTLREAIMALIEFAITHIRSVPRAQLDQLRTTIEGLTVGQIPIGGFITYPLEAVNQVRIVNGFMGGGIFRNNLEHFRSIMDTDSHVDLRGCLIGQNRDFLTLFRTFMGCRQVSAPDWLQSFSSVTPLCQSNTSIFSTIDSAWGSAGIAQIPGPNVRADFATWKGLIDFDAHFAFIRNLFTDAFRFASLGWQVWQTATTPDGIPVLRMQAQRIDDIATLRLENVIERFRLIFQVAANVHPDAAERTNLNTIQPYLATFQTLRAELNAISNAGDPGLSSLFTRFSTLAAQITTVFPSAAPLVPASNSLADLRISKNAIQTHVSGILTAHLEPFLAAVRTRLADPKAEIRYYCNIGLPLLLKATAHPTRFRVAILMATDPTLSADALFAHALRSWLKVQWKGTDREAAAMNGVIDAIPMNSQNERNEACLHSTVASGDSTLPHNDPLYLANPNSAVNPMPDFQPHIIVDP